MVSTVQPEQKKIGLYILGGAVLAALILLGGGGGFYFYVEAKKDNDAFALAQAGGTPSHYQTYLAQFPTGKHVPTVQKTLDELEWQATPRNVAGYTSYLKNRPNGIYAREAREKADDLVWASHGARGTVAGMRQYLELFPEGKNAQQARTQIEAKLTCNRTYAKQELAKVESLSGLVAANSDGASNLVSRKQGTAYSTTHYSGNYATTYHHDGSYSSQDGVEVRYRITNDSKFLVFSQVEGTVSFRTKAGAFWRGLAGGWLGAAVGATRDPNNGLNDGAVAGAKKGYEMAKHSEKVVISQSLAPGETYQGRAYMNAKYKVLNSEFKAERIRASISEAMLERAVAPGC